MSEARRCPQCGTEFSAETSPQGLCPACLLKLGLSDAGGTPVVPAPRVSRIPRRVPWWVWVVAAVAILVALVSLFRRSNRPRENPRVIRFSVDPPAGFVGHLAVSPD